MPWMKTVAVVIVWTDEALMAASYGADQVIVIDSADYAEYSTKATLLRLVNKYKPAAILIATMDGDPSSPCRSPEDRPTQTDGC